MIETADFNNRLWPAIVPEIPVAYLIDARQLGKNALVWPGQAYAVPGGCDFDCRHSLMERGEWRGPGAMIVMHYDQIHEYAEQIRMPAADYEWAVLLHEIGHAVLWKPYGELPFEPNAEFRAYLRERSQEQLTAVVANEMPWDNDHALPFVRRAIHAGYRAKLAGFDIEMSTVAAGFNYGLSPIFKYIEAFADEPSRLVRSTFAEIEQTPMPAAANELWDENMEFYRIVYQGEER